MKNMLENSIGENFTKFNKENEINNVSDNDVECMIRELISYLLANKYYNENDILKFKKVCNSNLTANNLLDKVKSLYNKYVDCKNNMESEKENYKKYCNKKNIKFDWNDELDSLYFTRKQNIINKIKKWHSIIS